MIEREQSSAAFRQIAMNGWDAASLLAMNQRALESWTRGISALSGEVGQFAQARLQEDMAMWGKYAACKDMNQAFEYQRQYAQKAVSDYLDEAKKLMRLATSILGESFPKSWPEGGAAASQQVAAS